MFKVRCETCGSVLKIHDDSGRGGNARCPKCDALVLLIPIVPAAAAARPNYDHGGDFVLDQDEPARPGVTPAVDAPPGPRTAPPPVAPRRHAAVASPAAAKERPRPRPRGGLGDLADAFGSLSSCIRWAAFFLFLLGWVAFSKEIHAFGWLSWLLMVALICADLAVCSIAGSLRSLAEPRPL
ncbi:hypothetical protein [Paludisphaera mucosa]|uniref:Zinc finger/thioredoxin putative domain-containing protein n=1 Tax=Paludisphaera mucosa TaxID=3030827 RepID=A0ABT6F5R3_9BACT|nr:hypothetical protein [Paludisphaera mucosa]MDG3002849.1 hypothetical protein [Paludisphaera mucosa]